MKLSVLPRSLAAVSAMALEEAPGFRRYRYREFGELQTADFFDAHLQWSGSFDSHTSSAHHEYQASWCKDGCIGLITGK